MPGNTGAIDGEQLTAEKSVVFLTSGSLDLGAAILARADLRPSFGKFTNPHQLMRLILAEQIDRGFNIM